MRGQKTIGIVGGGQLGRMLTIAALPMGFNVIVVDPTSNCPAHQVGAEEITADLFDKRALRRLAKKSDFLTIEIEHVDADLLAGIAKLGKPVNPDPKTIGLVQDKFLQKEMLKNAGINVAPFVAIEDLAEAEVARKQFGGSMIMKARHGAYDGRGNRVVKSRQATEKAMNDFRDRALYAEKLVPFVKELAVMVAKDMKGHIELYPIVETIQKRNICLEVHAPATITENVRVKAEKMILKTAQLLKGAGVFGVELFLTNDGSVLINEIAPRVHNSGHYTIEACRTSQFEQHIRAITGLPLGSTDMLVPAAVMINILGERNGPTNLKGVEKALQYPYTSLHLYGKSPTKIDRKMGHMTTTAKTLPEAIKQARAARSALSI